MERLKGVLLAQGMTYAELVEHGGVVNRDIADHHISLDDEAEHVGADLACIHDFPGGGAFQPALLQCGVDQTLLHLLEVDLIP